MSCENGYIRRKTLTLDGLNSASFGLYISSGGEYDLPQRDYTEQKIPGRNGSLIIDNGRYNNVEVSYGLLLFAPRGEFAEKMVAADSFLYRSNDYIKITDDYQPNYYRMGIPKGNLTWKISANNTVAEAKIKFLCKPQRYLTRGDVPKTFTATDIQDVSKNKIVNPTAFPSKPFLHIEGTGSGTVTIGDTTAGAENFYTLSITNISEFMDIDCEVRHAYKGSTNCNDCIVASNADYFLVQPGWQPISFTGDITSVSITGRWWTL